MVRYSGCNHTHPVDIIFCAAARARGNPPICCLRDQMGRALDAADDGVPGVCDPCKGLTPPDSE